MCACLLGGEICFTAGTSWLFALERLIGMVVQVLNPTARIYSTVRYHVHATQKWAWTNSSLEAFAVTL